MFGAVIDVPLVVGAFMVTAVFRKRFARAIRRVKLPLFLLFLLTSVPLVVFEEDINCMPSWCGQVLIPPTLPFIVVEIFVLGLAATLLHIRRAYMVVLAYCVFGVGWELTVGGLKGAPIEVDFFLIPYVALSYALVSAVPLEVLLGGKARQSTPAPGESAPLGSAGVGSGKDLAHVGVKVNSVARALRGLEARGFGGADSRFPLRAGSQRRSVLLIGFVKDPDGNGIGFHDHSPRFEDYTPDAHRVLPKRPLHWTPEAFRWKSSTEDPWNYWNSWRTAKGSEGSSSKGWP